MKKTTNIIRALSLATATLVSSSIAAESTPQKAARCARTKRTKERSKRYIQKRNKGKKKIPKRKIKKRI